MNCPLDSCPLVRPRPKEPDRIRVEERSDWHRASGDVLCEVCGLEYYAHDTVRGYPWLHRTCAGRLVKL